MEGRESSSSRSHLPAEQKAVTRSTATARRAAVDVTAL